MCDARLAGGENRGMILLVFNPDSHAARVVISACLRFAEGGPFSFSGTMRLTFRALAAKRKNEVR